MQNKKHKDWSHLSNNHTQIIYVAASLNSSMFLNSAVTHEENIALLKTLFMITVA